MPVEFGRSDPRQVRFLARAVGPCPLIGYTEDSRPWRYRLRVRTEPSQGSNTGSNPVSATTYANYFQEFTDIEFGNGSTATRGSFNFLHFSHILNRCAHTNEAEGPSRRHAFLVPETSSKSRLKPVHSPIVCDRLRAHRRPRVLRLSGDGRPLRLSPLLFHRRSVSNSTADLSR